MKNPTNWLNSADNLIQSLPNQHLPSSLAMLIGKSVRDGIATIVVSSDDWGTKALAQI